MYYLYPVVLYIIYIYIWYVLYTLWSIAVIMLQFLLQLELHYMFLLTDSFHLLFYINNKIYHIELLVVVLWISLINYKVWLSINWNHYATGVYLTYYFVNKKGISVVMGQLLSTTQWQTSLRCNGSAGKQSVFCHSCYSYTSSHCNAYGYIVQVIVMCLSCIRMTQKDYIQNL